MPEPITIEYDDMEAQVFLKGLVKNLKEVSEPLEKSGQFMRMEALANFPAKGQVFGESWPPLKKSTIKKKEKYWPGKPMMVRTGKLRDTFDIKKGKTWIEVSKPVSYAPLHQWGIGKLPRRVLLKIAKRQADNILKIFSEWLNKVIQKS